MNSRSKLSTQPFGLALLLGLFSACCFAQNLVQDRAPAQTSPAATRRYMGSASCQNCHAQIFERWKKTHMANVVRDPREHPDAILPDLTNPTRS